MPIDAILDQAFPTRAEAILALGEVSDESGVRLHAAASEAKRVSVAFGRAPAAERWHAFAEAIGVIALLLQWREAVLAAQTDADRFLRAARARFQALKAKPADDPTTLRFIETLEGVNGDIDLATITALRRKLAGIPMPVSVYADRVADRPDWAGSREEKLKVPDLIVAFVEFSINGEPVESIQSLRARQTYDLEIVVRVSRWPEAATALVLGPISIEPVNSYDLPEFSFTKPIGDAPFLLRQRGRMVLHTPQHLRARPFEFMYTAEFRPIAAEKPVAIAGQRALRLDGSDIGQHPLTGYPGIDSHLVSLRDTLRAHPQIPESDLSDLLEVVVPLANLMGQAVQDARFPKPISESEFQREVRTFLRQHPSIGSRLEEQAQAGGGRTDLSFKGIRLELKSETKKLLRPQNCEDFAAQAASYAVGTNRRVAVLCVLDGSPKTNVPFPAEDGLRVFPIETATGPIFVVSLLIQGNFRVPSAHSR